MESFNSESLLKKLKLIKAKVLVIFENLDSSSLVEESKYILYRDQIKEYLDQLASLESQVVDTYLIENVEEEVLEDFTKENTLFKIQVLEKLNSLKPVVSEDEDPLILNKGVKGIDLTPKIVCPKFCEKDLENDKLAFLNFQREFLNCVSTIDNDALKLVVLKNHLSGYAFQTVKHLSILDKNYPVALEILSQEFLNEKCIVNSIFSSLLKEENLNSDGAVKKFLSNVKTQLHELKNSFDLDFFQEGAPGTRLLSHVIFDKLPSVFKTELVHKVNINYPSLSQILKNGSDILKTLEFCKSIENDGEPGEMPSEEENLSSPEASESGSDDDDEDKE